MSRHSVLISVCLALATLTAAPATAQTRFPKLTVQTSGTTEGLIAVSPVNSKIVWAAGRHGTFLVTTDGGATWRSGQVPNAKWLQFRGVRAVSATTAYLLSIGNAPGNFRIYKTEDGGSTWTIEFKNDLAGAFYDCFAFWTPTRGIAHSDSVNGVFPDIRTEDGTTWQSIAQNMPPALSGEFSFSSSDTCVATQGLDNAWIATGGASIARILATTDGGDTWNAYDTPIVSSASAGAFTVDFRNPTNGIVGGGDLDPSDPDNARTAASTDGGQTWIANRRASRNRRNLRPKLRPSNRRNLHAPHLPGHPTLRSSNSRYRRSCLDSRRRHNLVRSPRSKRLLGSSLRHSRRRLASRHRRPDY